MLIRFDDTDAAIDIPDDAEFLAALRAAAFDWRFAEARGGQAPVATVRKAEDGYELSAPDAEPVAATAVGAACGVIVDAVKAAIDANPARLCFHCGSVAFNGRLVVFPSRFRAGKSTLVARLASGGHRVFGDDVLPLDESDRQGMATGIAPRLRLPLPETISDDFRRFVERHAAARDRRYLYLHPPGALAPRGTAAPLGAIVLLDRRPEGPAELYQASRSAVLRSLILRNFSRMAPADDLLDRLHRVTDRVPRFTLRYSNLDDATDLLERTFATWPPATDRLEAGDPAPASVEETDDPAPAPVRPEIPLRRNPAVRLRAVDGELFLTDTEGFGIHHLNPVGAGLWNLLAEPVSAAEAAEVLFGAFPDVDRGRIGRDVAALFAALAAEDFVIEADPADCIGPPGAS